MSTEFVGIELNLRGAKGVEEDLREIDRLLNSFRGRKQVDGGMKQLREDIVKARGELEKYIRLREKYLEAGGKGEAFSAEIKDARNKLKDVQQVQREVNTELRNMDRTFKEVFNSWSSKIAHVGSAMQSLGNAMTNMASPFGNLAKGVVFGAGFKVLNSFTSGLESGFTRYDTMKKFPKIMESLGFSSKQSSKAINQLNASVDGLPVSLDDAVNMAQRYIATTGSITKGTNIAIAANNAFLASMSTDAQRYQGMMQLQDVVGGKDMNAREWASLANSMLPAIRQMGKYLGYEGKELDEYVSKVQRGDIANEEFLDTFIKAGTDSKGSIRKMAEESMDTYEAFFSRVGTAASRMVYGVITTLDELSQSMTGMDVNQLLDKKIIPSIDATTESIKKWIKAHPEEITDFFKSLSKVHLGEFFKGMGRGIQDIAKMVKILSGLAGNNALFAWGRRLMRWNFTGKMLTVVGGLIKGLRHPLALIATLIQLSGRSLEKGGIFGKLMSIFGSKKAMETAEDAAKSIPSVASTFKGALSALQGVLTAAGAIGIASLTGFAAFRSFKSMMGDLKETINIMSEIDWEKGAGTMTALATFLVAFAGLGKFASMNPGAVFDILIGEVGVGLITTVAAGLADLDLFLFKQSMENLEGAIDAIISAREKMTQIGEVPEGVAANIKDAIAAMNEIIELFNGKNGSPMDRGEVTEGLKSFGRGKPKSIERLSEAIGYLQTLVNNLNTLSSIGIATNAVPHVKLIAKAANEVIKEMETLTKPISAPGNLAKNSESLATALIQIRRMAYHINKLADTPVNTGGFATFVQEIKSSLKELESLNGELVLDIEVKLSQMFGSSVNGVKKNITEAKRDIERLKTPIDITIPVNVKFSVTSNAYAAIARLKQDKQRVNNATLSPANRQGGGLIYRAKGGSVPFRRRGTDTIPAMLTPGEFVHNRQAVSAFGIDFMRKVNNLDIRGAMSELMHRAGHMANVNKSTHVTNNYNNNQKVVINNNGGSGADYTFKRASRFVGAI